MRNGLKDLLEEAYGCFISCYLMASFVLWASMCTFFSSLGASHAFITGSSSTVAILMTLLIVHLYIREL